MKKKPRTLIVVLGSLFFCAAVAGIVYWRIVHSPQYSLQQIMNAFDQHDASTFEKYVDIESIVQRAGGQLTSEVREAVLSFVETRRIPPIGYLPGDTFDKASDIRIESIGRPERYGKMCSVHLQLSVLEKPVHVKLYMRNTGPYWQVFEIDNLLRTTSELLLAHAIGENKRIEGGHAAHPEIEVIVNAGTTNEVQSLTLCYVPAGTFMMGSPKNEVGRGEDEEPRHKVTVTEPFWMGKYEVTNSQFAAFVQETGYVTTAEKEGNGFSWDPITENWEVVVGASWRDHKLPWPSKGDLNDHPVVMVSWDDATAFCAWLSQKTGDTYGLPTEAQWEYACRAGTGSSRYWGESLDAACKYGNFFNKSMKGKFKMTWDSFPCEDGYEITAPVGMFEPNAFGLHDMLGNVWEWCDDWHDDYPTEAATDPRGPKDGTDRVLRGGSWLLDPWGCRSAVRSYNTPDSRYGFIGSRVVRTS